MNSIIKLSELGFENLRFTSDIEKIKSLLVNDEPYCIDFYKIRIESRCAANALWYLTKEHKLYLVRMDGMSKLIYEKVIISHFLPEVLEKSTTEFIKCDTVEDLKKCLKNEETDSCR